MSNIAIPEGFELLHGRNRKNAQEAISRAEERGFPTSSVLTHPEGYLIPTGEVDAIETEPGAEGNEPVELVGEPIELPKATASKAEQEAFAEKHGIDLSETTNAETRAAAIQAWADALPQLTAEAADTEKEN